MNISAMHSYTLKNTFKFSALSPAKEEHYQQFKTALNNNTPPNEALDTYISACETIDNAKWGNLYQNLEDTLKKLIEDGDVEKFKLVLDRYMSNYSPPDLILYHLIKEDKTDFIDTIMTNPKFIAHYKRVGLNPSDTLIAPSLYLGKIPLIEKVCQYLKENKVPMRYTDFFNRHENESGHLFDSIGKGRETNLSDTDFNKIVGILKESGYDINASTGDNYGNSALICAIQDENLPLAKALIANGADVNKPNITDRTPLDYAKNPELKTLLQENGGKAGPKTTLKREIFEATNATMHHWAHIPLPIPLLLLPRDLVKGFGKYLIKKLTPSK